jgi:hypothetical protein
VNNPNRLRYSNKRPCTLDIPRVNKLQKVCNTAKCLEAAVVPCMTT